MLCTKCGAQIDDSASVCTHCGAQISTKKNKKSIFKKWWFWVLIAIAFILIAGNAKSDSNPSGTPEPTEKVLPKAIKVSASELCEAYTQNEVDAEKKYGDQLVEITGTVDNIGTDIRNDVYITLSTGKYMQSIQCYFNEDAEIDKVATLSIGQEVTIIGTCKGLSFINVAVKECSFANIASPGADDAPESIDPENNIIAITAGDLFAAYNENEVAANSKYKDKKLQITGTISNIGIDILDRVYITLDASETLYSVQCYFANSDEDAKVAELKKGDTITLIGVCEGISLNVTVKQCEIQ